MEDDVSWLTRKVGERRSTFRHCLDLKEKREKVYLLCWWTNWFRSDPLMSQSSLMWEREKTLEWNYYSEERRSSFKEIAISPWRQCLSIPGSLWNIWCGVYPTIAFHSRLSKRQIFGVIRSKTPIGLFEDENLHGWLRKRGRKWAHSYGYGRTIGNWTELVDNRVD